MVRILNFLVFAPLLLTVTAALAQVTGGPQPGGAAAIPVDGGASLLLAAGAAYGLKKLRQRRRGGR